ncbi:MAG: 4-(cytidine 5'-diphospho)-2-C-methyl-D-erythritol kinase [Bacteroidetes bacterium]|nr:4-(cytidine 5'-diphospho)-2-C-methyl-D-erythritol kinase [Bacteroidota bacterium]
MIVFPNAKINLGLNIVEKRSDGFHNIETVFYPIGLSDVLEVLEYKGKSKKQVQFKSTGIPIPGKGSENLCVKAYHLLAKQYDLPPIKIHLHKIIPIGAGLGGGSADAAFFLKALNTVFELNLSFGELHHYARQLGSDCSFFISNQPVFAEGKGDEMEHINVNLKDKYLVLIKPPIHISTKEAYANVKPQKPAQSLEKLILKPINTWKNAVHNQFEDSVFPQFPEVKVIKEKLYAAGAEYAAMSGSGSAVYGLFNAQVDLQKQFKSCFVWQEMLK